MSARTAHSPLVSADALTIRISTEVWSFHTAGTERITILLTRAHTWHILKETREVDHAQARIPSDFLIFSSRASSTSMKWPAASRRTRSSSLRATIPATECTPTSSTVGKTVHCLIFSLLAHNQSMETKTLEPARTSSPVVRRAAVACPSSTRRRSINLANSCLAATPSPTPTLRRLWLSHR